MKTRSPIGLILAICGNALLATLAFISLTAHAQQIEVASSEASQTLLLTVVGPDEKPLPGADVEWRIYPAPEALPMKFGTLIKKGRYGFQTRTDEQGRIEVIVPSDKQVQASIKVDGFGPYWAEWHKGKTGESIPAEFQVQLDAAWVVGGVIVDDAGKPVSGVEIDPSVKFKKRPGDTAALGVGTRISTDAEGKWRYTMIPDAKQDVFVEISHPDYIPTRLSLSRDKYELVGEAEPTASVTLHRGLEVTGMVTDADGKPIEGALVRSKFLNNKRQATTDENGVYHMRGCEPRQARFVASAEGFALEMVEARVDEAMKPVDFEMKPGGHVRIRVVDEKGKGIPKSRIFFQRLNGKRIKYFEFDHISQRTDENGVWEWNEAPIGGFHADICPPEGTTLSLQPIMPREEEYVFIPPPRLIISGRVTDAITGEPIPEFRVVPGIQGSEESTHLDWVERDALAAKGGEYRLTHLRQAYFAHLIRIEAPGYQPRVSRNIKSNEGSITLDFELKKGSDINSLVKNVAGKPVVGADVVLGIAGSQISLQNGRVDGDSVYNAKQTRTDEQGRFRFDPQLSPFHLVIVHDDGYAHVECKPNQEPTTIELIPWGVVRGIYRVGPKAVADVTIDLSSETIHAYGEESPNIFAHFDATTGQDGAFVFGRVPQGNAWVRREIVRMVGEGATEVASTPIRFVAAVAGKTQEVQLGGNGVVVKGQLATPKGAEEFDWKQVSVNITTLFAPMPRPPVPEEIANDQEKRSVWMLEWRQTPDGQKWTLAYKQMQQRRAELPRFYATVGKDGKFDVADIPAGTYQFRARTVGAIAGQPRVIWTHQFEVSETTKNGEKQDLGKLPVREL